MIIGVTGNYGSGKDTLAEILQEKNFYHVSFSDILREKLTSLGKEITRDNLIDFANELRNEQGANILAKLALEKVQENNDYVFTSIRNPEEVKELQKRENFTLVNVVASETIRLERILKRGRDNEKEPRTLEELREKEARENTSDPNKQQLNKVAEMADIIINNDSTLGKLEEEVGKLLGNLIVNKEMRPTPEQLERLRQEKPERTKYYMEIAKQVCVRCNCLTTRHGTVIVKDDQIISTGYNGAPRKVRDCMERGTCIRRELKIPSGQRYELCRTVHSEANAIINAARAGISVLDGDMYIFSEKIWKDERKVIDAHPCFICKKFVINAGIKNVFCKQADGKIKRYVVQDWVTAWKEGDMTDDMDIYDSNYGGMKKRGIC